MFVVMCCVCVFTSPTDVSVETSVKKRLELIKIKAVEMVAHLKVSTLPTYAYVCMYIHMLKYTHTSCVYTCLSVHSLAPCHAVHSPEDVW